MARKKDIGGATANLVNAVGGLADEKPIAGQMNLNDFTGVIPETAKKKKVESSGKNTPKKSNMRMTKAEKQGAKPKEPAPRLGTGDKSSFSIWMEKERKERFDTYCRIKGYVKADVVILAIEKLMAQNPPTDAEIQEYKRKLDELNKF